MKIGIIGPAGRNTLASLLLLMGWAAGMPLEVGAQTNAPLDKLKAMAADDTETPDLARASLLAAQMIRPTIDPEAYLKQVDTLAADVKDELAGVDSAVTAVNILSNYLYNVQGYANSQVLPADVFVGLDQVLDGQQWNCLGMSLLYATLGARTGIPLRVVAGHGHVLVAYAGPQSFYLETTAGGRLEADRSYLRDYLPFPCTNPSSYVTLDERESVALCLSQMALAVYQESRVELAKSLYQLALEFDADHAEAHAGLAFIAADEGNTTAAVAGFEKAVSLSPDFREAYGGLGNSLAAQGETTRAVEAYRTLVSLCSDDEVALFNMGQLLYDIGDLEGSVVAYENYIDLAPDDPLGYLRIAFPLEDQGNLARAAEAYDRVLQLAPNHVNAIANLAHLNEQIGDRETALNLYGRALDLRPDHLQAMAGAGRVLGQSDRYNEALGMFREALRVYPGESFLWIDLGRLFEDYGEFKQAIGAYQEATRVGPEDTEAYLALARALDNVGLGQDAQQVRARARVVQEKLDRREALPLPVAVETPPIQEGLAPGPTPAPAPAPTTDVPEMVVPPTAPSAELQDGGTVPPVTRPGEKTVTTRVPVPNLSPEPAPESPVPEAARPRLPSTKTDPEGEAETSAGE